ncbi:glutaminase A [Branchiibius sp. NY16-3462-2]|uniref:glutaminase A n=1 Tax=Branchiibius sp. NY16-3462-2 TaxID=1807500 RepID=UPI0007964908|nr:glutaminase A [Branchiibius sp. NY16-3462-2]KYH45932.1 glutaminase [Branchiibius sp. NY16-3462-2]
MSTDTADHRYVSSGDLPGQDEADAWIGRAYDAFRTDADGTVSTVYPVLAEADPDKFAMCLTTVDGASITRGDLDQKFVLMSVSKSFVLALVCEQVGLDVVRRVVGVNPTGLPFNSLAAIERFNDGRTNPMVNAGAIATSSLVPGSDFEERWILLTRTMSAFAGRPLTMDQATYDSARTTNMRNRSIAYLLSSYGAINGDAMAALDLYTRQCCLEVTASDLAVMGATLATGGVNPVTKERVVSAHTAHAVLAIMTIAGMYENSGDWFLDVGVPAKSGISGGIVSVSPGKGALATYSAPLDTAGNSVRGVKSAIYLSQHLGLDVVAVPD